MPLGAECEKVGKKVEDCKVSEFNQDTGVERKLPSQQKARRAAAAGVERRRGPSVRVKLSPEMLFRRVKANAIRFVLQFPSYLDVNAQSIIYSLSVEETITRSETLLYRDIRKQRSP